MATKTIRLDLRRGEVEALRAALHLYAQTVEQDARRRGLDPQRVPMVLNAQSNRDALDALLGD